MNAHRPIRADQQGDPLDAVRTHQLAMRRACQRVILECDIALEADRRALRIVKRITRHWQPRPHSFDLFDAAKPIKRRLIEKLRGDALLKGMEP